MSHAPLHVAETIGICCYLSLSASPTSFAPFFYSFSAFLPFSPSYTVPFHSFLPPFLSVCPRPCVLFFRHSMRYSSSTSSFLCYMIHIPFPIILSSSPPSVLWRSSHSLPTSLLPNKNHKYWRILPRRLTSVIPVMLLEISFNKSQYTASLSEAAPPGTVLVRVKASSYPLQQDIAYFLRSENLHLPTKFAVDTQTGLITLMRSLDREMTSDYFLEIEARYMVLNASGRAEYKSTKCYVVVHVQDHNDNAPFFPRSHYYVHVPCNASVGKTVYRARAQDRDDGPNGQLRYRLMSWHDYFGMSHGGKVKVTKDMRPFCTSSPLRSFILTVQARDSGSVPLSARAYIHVIVTPPGKLSRGPAVNEELWTAGANLQRDQAKSRRSKLPLPRRKQTRWKNVISGISVRHRVKASSNSADWEKSRNI